MVANANEAFTVFSGFSAMPFECFDFSDYSPNTFESKV